MSIQYSTFIDFVKQKSLINIIEIQNLSKVSLIEIKNTQQISEHQSLILLSSLSKLFAVCSCRISNPIIVNLSSCREQQINNSINPNIITCIISLDKNQASLYFSKIDREELVDDIGKIVVWSNVDVDNKYKDLLIEQKGNCQVILINIALLKIE